MEEKSILVNFQQGEVDAVILYKRLGGKAVSKMLAKGELASLPMYEKYVSSFPKLKEIMADEARHAQVVKALASK